MTKIINNIKTALLRGRKYRQTVTELQSLSNKELADIGISRGEIYSVARQSI